MILLNIPLENAWADTSKVDLSLTATSDKGSITKGQKNIPFDLSYINIAFDPSFRLYSESKLKEIKVYAGLEDETYKFNLSATNGFLSLNLKNAALNNPYQLRKHTLYNVYIPEDVFIKDSTSQTNRGENYTFVTSSDGATYKKDILKNVTPQSNTSSVDYKNGNIVFEFVDEIALNPDAIGHMGEYIHITTTPIDPYIPSYQGDSIENYNVKIEGNKLILQGIDGKLKDFAKYTVKIKNKTVYLKGSPDIDGKIYNQAEWNIDGEYEVIQFNTDDMIEKTDPLNNAEYVSVEPTIKFEFKYPVDVDFNKITFVEDNSSDLSIKIPTDISLSTDKKTLYIKVNDSDAQGKYPLRRNTIYKVSIKGGANAGDSGVVFKDYPSVRNKEDINLYFITTGQGDHPVPFAYSSNDSFTDDIRKIEETNLSEDGSIYVKFNRGIQWDKEKENITPIGATHLYKIPTANEKAYSSKGEWADKQYQYKKESDGNIYLKNTPYSFNGYKEEVGIESVEIVGEDTIKIKPKYTLLNRNQYEVIIDKALIEDKNGYNMKEDLECRFWTKSSSSSIIPSWDVSSIKASEIKESENAPYKSYKIYGAPQYSSTNPIVIHIKGEVIPLAKDVSIEEKDLDGDGNIDRVFQSKSLEKIILSTAYYIQGTKAPISANTDTASVDIGKVLALSLAESISPKGETVKWVSKDSSIAKVDEDGNVEGVSRGATQIIAISPLGKTLSTIEVTVKEGDLKISEFKLEYYEENNAKNTKLYLYPNKNLENGKGYTLFIPQGVLESRSKNDLSSLELNFVVTGDISKGSGIEKVEMSSLSMSDLMEKEEVYFSIYGYNFDEKITSVVLSRADDPTKTITIDKKDIYFKGVDEIKVAIRGSVKDAIIKAAYYGNYNITLNMNGKVIAAPALTCYLKFGAMGIPELISKFPDENKSYDEKSLSHLVKDELTKDKYFIKLTFKDTDGNLRFNGDIGLDNILSSSVKSGTSGVSMIDSDFISMIKNKGDYEKDGYVSKYLFVKNTEKKEAYLYIPVKLLSPQISYSVIIRSGIIRNDAGENAEINWSFKTEYLPYISNIIVGSVPEDYDEEDPIILKGDFFSENVKVYFNDIEAEDIKIKEIEDSNGQKEVYLHVYLPTGRDRLDVGVYNIKIVNDDNHETIEYGSFSVVKSGEFVPNEEYRVKSDEKEGEVRENIKVSEDTIILSSKYKDKSYIEFDLDELMGEDTLVRKIVYEENDSSTLGTIVTKSKYADITLYGLSATSSNEENDVVISLGRVEPIVEKNIKDKLRGKNVISDLIQVSGEYFKVDRLELKIPFKDSSGDNIKVLRYDEEMRNWYDVTFTVDKVNKVVYTNSSEAGIFAVVE